MDPKQEMMAGANANRRHDQVDLIDILIMLAKYKKLIVGIPAIVAVLAASISFLLPNVYLATTKILPPQQAQSAAAALLSQLGSVTSLATGIGGIKNPSDIYIGMLRSRTIADTLIARFDLKKVYEEESLEEVRKKLEARTAVTIGKDGLISIAVEDEDRKRAALLANAYVDELMKLASGLAVTEAAQRRVFFERQLGLAKDNLAAVEVKLKRELGTHGVISVDADSRAIVETVARLRAQVSAKEIQINAMGGLVTKTNPQYIRAQEELRSLKEELGNLENGRPNIGKGDLRQQGLENIKLLRDVKYYQMLYELLAKQYEVARLDEAKDPLTIQVLDPAIEPEKKVKPKRALMVLLSFFITMIFTVIWVWMYSFKERAMAHPQNAARVSQLVSLVFSK
ncbi:GumC family protein [Massilia alkalitolerans]|uniref:GumC family protein n=1 Tax=Massilia alkalitolerans TaxID=286638 RepID=UPI0028AE5158|nr:Wzz/FepE/Etk N-terminal domain-containing protein [Massilia alkalitolerans]